MSSPLFTSRKVVEVSRDRRRSEFGEALGERLAVSFERTLTQRSLADRVGVNESTVSLWISGRIPDAWQRLRQVCEAAGASADYLLGLPTRQPDVDAAIQFNRAVGAVMP